ncbi:hypothetical protein RNJ44_00393 [Nakaseomyces bracarensis]|uniref:Alpha-1,3-mannosyltransferase n=1 Tax=Nakaseomyces bracarensis TaxID=273131 RepID=A0ABR4NSE9_9SACH
MDSTMFRNFNVQGRKKLSIYVGLLLTIALLVWNLSTYRDDTVTIGAQGLYRGTRKALPKSVFKTYLENTKSKEKDEVGEWNADRTPRAEKCKLLITALGQQGYDNHPTPFEITAQSFSFTAGLAESIRLYSYCFMDGDLSIHDILHETQFSNNKEEILERIFPFLKLEVWDDIIWPQIELLNKDKILTPPKVYEPLKKFNIEFLSNWRKASKGKGIVTTFGAEDVELFIKQLRSLRQLGNNLPIELVTHNNNLPTDKIELIREYAKKFRQNVYIIDVTNVLNKEYADKYIQGFNNKWIASIFNTFEEFILLDADAIPFNKPVEFFRKPEYRATGMYLYQDRHIPSGTVDKKCLEILKAAELSGSESRVLNSGFKVNPFLTNEKDYQTANERSYYKLFAERQLHHVDSGLVIVNKKKSFDSLLMGFLLNTDTKLSQCFHGDKEFFWIGALMSNNDYFIDERKAAIVGAIGGFEQDNRKYHKICSAQIGHVSADNKIEWINGGLKVCKFKDCAKQDFEREPDFFNERHREVSLLQDFYDSPLLIDGFMVDSPPTFTWMNVRECKMFMYCLFNDRSPAIVSNAPPNSDFVQFTTDYQKKINKITQQWTESLDL